LHLSYVWGRLYMKHGRKGDTEGSKPLSNILLKDTKSFPQKALYLFPHIKLPK